MLVAFVLVEAALAQTTFTTVQFPVIDPADPSAPTFIANGVGAPTVAWDPALERYILFFETRTGNATADCPFGEWAIGVASSDDGVAWDVWPEPLVAPGTPGTPYRCVAAHPAVLYENGTFHLWFKAEQGVVDAACGHPWGCSNYSGVGYASVLADLDDKTDEIAAKEQEIADTEADRDAAITAYNAALIDYRDALQTNQSAFACLDALDEPLPLCAPCSSITLTASTSSFQDHSFCQDFQFAIPATLDSQNTTSPHLGRLAFTDNGGNRVICKYPWTNATQAYTFQRCEVNGVFQPQYLVGTLVTTEYARNARVTNGTPGAVVSVTLGALNLQELEGSLIERLDELIDSTAANDPVLTEILLTDFILDLETMRDYLETFQQEPQLGLYLDTLGLIADGGVILALQEEIRDLQQELEELQNYAPSASSTPVADAVALSVGGLVFGYPNVAKIDGEYVMLVQNYPDIWRATGTSPTSFTLDAAPAVQAGAVFWAETEVFEPGLTCTGDPQFPLQTWIGGRRVVAGTTTGGLSDTISDGISWLFNTTAAFVPGGSANDGTWSSPDLYRHFDAMRSSTGATRVWYSQKVNGINKIGLMTTSTNWAHPDTQNRDCDAL